MTLAMEMKNVGKKYKQGWGLRNCDLRLPTGRVCALIGPNGAGKSTLLQLAVGLLLPTEGNVRVFDLEPAVELTRVLPLVGYVAQDRPLYRGFSVDEMLRLGQKLNPSWDDELATGRLQQLGIPRERKTGQLSGGQQAQVSLVLALAKRPRLLLLDEPVAAFDPIARRDFWRVLLDSVAEDDLTVLVSSHIVTEMEQVCDHLVLLSDSRVLLEGPIDEILAEHRFLQGTDDDLSAVDSEKVVWRRTTERQTSIIACGDVVLGPRVQQRRLTLEDIALAYLEAPVGLSRDELNSIGAAR